MLNSNYNFMVWNWLGKIESNDRSGIATFLINKNKFKFELDSFHEFEKIHDLTTLAFEKGMQIKEEEIKQKLKKVILEPII